MAFGHKKSVGAHGPLCKLRFGFTFSASSLSPLLIVFNYSIKCLAHQHLMANQFENGYLFNAHPFATSAFGNWVTSNIYSFFLSFFLSFFQLFFGELLSHCTSFEPREHEWDTFIQWDCWPTYGFKKKKKKPCTCQITIIIISCASITRPKNSKIRNK